MTVPVSVVIPCFNGAQHLGEALESVRAQTRSAHEVIVVDDGSTDGSAVIAHAFGAVVVTQPNRGEGAARNRGAAVASGDAIAFLDADDRWRPRHIEVVSGLLEQYPNAVGAFGAMETFGAVRQYLPGYVAEGGERRVLKEAFRDWLHGTIAAIVRREALIEVGGFDEVGRSAVDYDFWLRLALEHSFVATSEVTAEWRWHSDQQSSTRSMQYAALYRYRRQFIDGLTARGRHDLAEVFEREFAKVWRREMITALTEEDCVFVGVMSRAAETVPRLPAVERGAWRALIGRRTIAVPVALLASRALTGASRPWWVPK